MRRAIMWTTDRSPALHAAETLGTLGILNDRSHPSAHGIQRLGNLLGPHGRLDVRVRGHGAHGHVLQEHRGFDSMKVPGCRWKDFARAKAKALRIG